jgi:hypothetical protein
MSGPGSPRAATPGRRGSGWPPAARLAGRRVDPGAGTGILSGAVACLDADIDADIVAVEPDQAMLAELRRRLPGVRAVEGSAAVLPGPDHGADVHAAGEKRRRRLHRHCYAPWAMAWSRPACCSAFFRARSA